MIVVNPGWKTQIARRVREALTSLQVHRVVYITALDPWMYRDELLLVLCDWHHKERQAVDQPIYVELGKHLFTLDIHQLCRQPLCTFSEDDGTLNYLSAWHRDYVRYERDQA